MTYEADDAAAHDARIQAEGQVHVDCERQDRDGHTAGVPVVPPGAALGSYVWMR